MIDPKITRNYANCLFDNIKSDKDHELILKQLALMNEVLVTTPGLHFALCAPIISRTEKLKLIAALDKKFHFEKMVSQFLEVIIKNARFNILPGILSEYQKLLTQKRGIKRVVMESANKPEKKELEIIKKYLENKLKKVVELEVHDNKSLIGGAVIKYDSMLYDYSVSGAIDRAEKLAKEAVV